MNRFTTSAVALTVLASVAGAATIVDMSFVSDSQAGQPVPGEGLGSGSFTFTGSGPTFGLSDITDFSFTVTRDLPTIFFTSTFEFGLSDLTSLVGTVDQSGNVVSLEFATILKQPVTTNGFSGDYGFRTQGASFGSIYQEDPFEGLFDDLTGQMTYTTVPAPGALVALAAAGLAGARRRRH